MTPRGLLDLLLRLGRTVDEGLRDATGRAGFTPAQAAALRFAVRTRPDMATVGHLARLLGVRHATAIGILQPLLQRGLVERRPHPYDRRRRVLAATPAGRALEKRIDELTNELALVLADLPPERAAALAAGLEALVAALQRRGLLVVAAPCAGCIYFQPNTAQGSPRPHHCRLIRRFLTDEESRMECPEHTAA
jgi:DNA-binding MarR family transcriptional regulator